MKAVILVLLSLLTLSPAFAEVTAVSASVDKNPVMLDEAIRLTVTAEGDAPRDAFDSSALLGDFVVGRTSVSSQTSIVNFDTSKTITWTTTLFPRDTGTFTIPSFTIEGKQTSSFEVKVIPVENSSGGEARDYFVTTEIASDSVYLQQQIYYTAKLYLATNIERGSLQAPEMANGDIRQLGEDKQYTDIKNGKRYQVIERNFAIVPQASGEFTIRGPVFTGEVVAANSGQRFGFFNRTQQVNRIGPDIVVNVKPVPDDFDGHWLPSEMVRIDEEWPKGEQYRVGEPVTRVITLTALGLVEEQLPEFPNFYPPGFKQYPDQASTSTVEKDNNLIAQRQESLALIPTKAGDYVLPEVTIPWFNIVTGETEYATLDARTITVEPASAAATGAPAPASAPSPSGSETQPSAPTPASDDSAPASVKPVWQYASFQVLCLVLILALAGWVATIVYYRRQQHSLIPRAHTAPQHVHGNETEKAAYANLEQAVKAGDAAAIASALARWMTTLVPEGQSVSPADYQATAILQPIMDQLHATRYGKASEPRQPADTKTLRKAIEEARRAWGKQGDEPANRLQPLYPG
ncbi:BatD family protein [Alteromonas halophila]|uniref:DUF7939 domain-containing protein n=1 Tax=Alteromonas halophila TaxID=516698 RepID=A0A918MUM5_9ALTE|nr:BatD family protein [Alteromonas halophila]GGW74492.1 hypothetical protein GCM10007391_03080 [Alteromonas halophila]